MSIGISIKNDNMPHHLHIANRILIFIVNVFRYNGNITGIPTRLNTLVNPSLKKLNIFFSNTKSTTKVVNKAVNMKILRVVV